MTLIYNAPTANKSSIDGDGSNQHNSWLWLRKSLIEARKDQYFTPLADVTKMPQHYGKTIKVYEYVPLLDDRNVNDQGIDANGVTFVNTTWSITNIRDLVTNFTETKIDALVLALNNAAGKTIATKDGSTSSTGMTVTTNSIFGMTGTQWTAIETAYEDLDGNPDAGDLLPVKDVLGNIYGSAKDIGSITGKLPVLSETGGRFNRVGFTRLTHEGQLHKFGFFYEFTNESLIFDTDPQLKEHLAREMMNGAVQIYEATLQADLINAATKSVVYPADATGDSNLTGNSPDSGSDPDISKVAYEDFGRLDRMLTAARTPKQTKIITGSRNIDTKVIPASRIMYVGPDVVPLLKAMEDPFSNQAFIGVQHYASAGTTLPGEIGSIDGFRIIEVPEMQFWEGGGAVEDPDDNGGYQVGPNPDDGVIRYNVYPMLVVGTDSFTTIGLQSNGTTGKFSVITKMPGIETAEANHDPFGEKGFSSIKWYYGTLVFRPERLGMIKTVAPN